MRRDVPECRLRDDEGGMTTLGFLLRHCWPSCWGRCTRQSLCCPKSLRSPTAILSRGRAICDAVPLKRVPPSGEGPGRGT